MDFRRFKRDRAVREARSVNFKAGFKSKVCFRQINSSNFNKLLILLNAKKFAGQFKNKYSKSGRL